VRPEPFVSGLVLAAGGSWRLGRPVPLDVDTWQDYEAVLGAAALS
jgi:hypothetical protein